MVKAKVREEYRCLSHQELLEKGEELGFNYLVNSFACSQCTVVALHELLGFDPMLVRSATGLSGGTAEQFLGTCGALAGGVMVLSYYFGRPIEQLSDKEYLQDNIDALGTPFELAMLLADRFVEEYGTYVCTHMHRKFFGRIYCLTDPEEVEKFKGAGGIDKAGTVVGKAVRWTLEILLNKGAIE